MDFEDNVKRTTLHIRGLPVWVRETLRSEANRQYRGLNAQAIVLLTEWAKQQPDAEKHRRAAEGSE